MVPQEVGIFGDSHKKVEMVGVSSAKVMTDPGIQLHWLKLFETLRELGWSLPHCMTSV